MTICIVTNQADWRADVVGKADIVIAADGGLDVCLRHQVEPEYVVGDFDSAIVSTPASSSEWTHDAHKDYSDLEAALGLAETLQSTAVSVLTSFNGRADHVLGNITIASQHPNVTALHTAHSDTFVIGGEQAITGKGYFSVLALVPSRLTISGAKYQLHDGELQPGSGLGLSNEFTDQPATITVHIGRVMVVVPNV